MTRLVPSLQAAQGKQRKETEQACVHVQGMQSFSRQQGEYAGHGGGGGGAVRTTVRRRARARRRGRRARWTGTGASSSSAQSAGHRTAGSCRR